MNKLTQWIRFNHLVCNDKDSSIALANKYYGVLQNIIFSPVLELNVMHVLADIFLICINIFNNLTQGFKTNRTEAFASNSSGVLLNKYNSNSHAGSILTLNSQLQHTIIAFIHFCMFERKFESNQFIASALYTDTILCDKSKFSHTLLNFLHFTTTNLPFLLSYISAQKERYKVLSSYQSRRETFSFRRMKGINNNFCSMEGNSNVIKNLNHVIEIKSELLKTFFLLYLQLTRFVTSYLPLFLNQQNHHHHILDKNNLILCKTNNLCATNNGSDGTINTKNYYNHSCHHNSHNWSKRKCTKISRKNG